MDKVKKSEPSEVAPKSVLISDADLVLTVLSEFILMNVVALGFVRVKMLEPTVFAPKSDL